MSAARWRFAPNSGCARSAADGGVSAGARAVRAVREVREGGEVREVCTVRRRQVGFTLLEMLVVLVIAGILISAAALTVSRNPRTDLREEAQRLALLFESAGDEAQVRARPIAWQPVDGGYRFDMRTEDGWRPLRDDLLRERPWQAGITGVAIRHPNAGGTASRLVFGLETVDLPVDVTLYSNVGQISIVGTGNGRYEVR